MAALATFSEMTARINLSYFDVELSMDVVFTHIGL